MLGTSAIGTEWPTVGKVLDTSVAELVCYQALHLSKGDYH
jgi:hypothetical protein